MNTRAIFFPQCFYHVYNQTNNAETLFRSNENRRFFLERFSTFLKPYCHVHSYALMSNHFHFSISIKSSKEILEYASQLKEHEKTNVIRKFITSEQNGEAENDKFHLLICDQFKRFFTSYTRAYNNLYNRSGSLFRQKFKRSIYDPKLKFKYLQYYIHHNGRKHGAVKNFKDYKYHSYQEIVADNSNLIDRLKVLKWYDGLEDFIVFHESVQYEEVFRDIDIDGFFD